MKGMMYILGAMMVGTMATHAQTNGQIVEYRSGGVTMKGYLAYNETLPMQRPGVLVVHEWWGLNDYAKSRADELARLGYVALAVDMYGDGTNVATQAEAKALASPLREDRGLMRERIHAALTFLKKQPLVDPQQIAAIGYCFGGTVALELARSGADVAGVVSFHGNLDTPEPTASSNIQARVLVLHGADDSFVPMQQVVDFQNEMRQSGADWQMNIYGDAVHSFTNPNNGTNKSSGVAYNEKAAKRSWEAMKSFLTELFGQPHAYVSRDYSPLRHVYVPSDTEP